MKETYIIDDRSWPDWLINLNRYWFNMPIESSGFFDWFGEEYDAKVYYKADTYAKLYIECCPKMMLELIMKFS